MNILSVIIFTYFINFIQSSNDTIYLLAYSWTPGFCYENKNKYPGCIEPEDYWLNHFTIHGLWPQYITTGYPQFCTDEQFDILVPPSIGINSMATYWPNVKSSSTSNPDYDDFWQHEWDKHGTCSELSQTNYFNYTIELSKIFGTPQILINSIFSDDAELINTSQLRDSMGGPHLAALQCYDSILTGVYTCWTQIDGVPQYKVTCPEEVQKEDTCIEEYIGLQ